MLSYCELTMEFSLGESMGSIYLSNLDITWSNPDGSRGLRGLNP
jgi:hypothetical protein